MARCRKGWIGSESGGSFSDSGSSGGGRPSTVASSAGAAARSSPRLEQRPTPPPSPAGRTGAKPPPAISPLPRLGQPSGRYMATADPGQSRPAARSRWGSQGKTPSPAPESSDGGRSTIRAARGRSPRSPAPVASAAGPPEDRALESGRSARRAPSQYRGSCGQASMNINVKDHPPERSRSL